MTVKTCACGCGAHVSAGATWKLGHHMRSPEGRARARANGKKNVWTPERRQAVREKVTGSASGSWKGGRYVDDDGYVNVTAKGHPRCMKTGYAYEHLLVAEAMLGRPLLYYGHNHPKNETPHHKNGIRDDNRPENLQIMTHSEHMRFHAIEKNQEVPGRFKRGTIIRGEPCGH